jgi:hypothetical protein
MTFLCVRRDMVSRANEQEITQVELLIAGQNDERNKARPGNRNSRLLCSCRPKSGGSFVNRDPSIVLHKFQLFERKGINRSGEFPAAVVRRLQRTVVVRLPRLLVLSAPRPYVLLGFRRRASMAPTT